MADLEVLHTFGDYHQPLPPRHLRPDDIRDPQAGWGDFREVVTIDTNRNNSYFYRMSNLGKYINPFTDFGFKKLFGTEFNKELLVDFLNQVLGERGAGQGPDVPEHGERRKDRTGPEGSL